MTLTAKPAVCFSCKHFNQETSKCPAFKGDIPDEIIFNGNKHTKPLPGQKNDIVFEPISKK